MKKEGIEFNPSEHIATPEAEDEDVSNAESFISLKAIADPEKARIFADAIQQEVQPLFEELTTAQLMMAEANDPEEKEYLEEEIKKIQSSISKKIAAQPQVSVDDPQSIADIIVQSKLYDSFAPSLQVAVNKRGNPQRRFRPRESFSEAEKKVLSDYDRLAATRKSPEQKLYPHGKIREKAIDVLKESNNHQVKVLQFLVEKGFQIPAGFSNLDPNIYRREQRELGELLCVAMNKFGRTEHDILQDLHGETKTPYENFKKNFQEMFESFIRDIPNRPTTIEVANIKEKVSIEAINEYLTQPELKNILDLVRAFGIKIELPKSLGMPKIEDVERGGWKYGTEEYLSSFLNINYDVAKIEKLLGEEEAKRFIVSDVPNEIRIEAVPFPIRFSADLQKALESAQRLGQSLERDPQEVIEPWIGTGDSESFWHRFRLFHVLDSSKKQQASPSRVFFDA